MELIGVILGFALSQGLSWLTSNRKLKAHWSAIQVEMVICHELAKTYLSEASKMGFIAPIYRFPSTAFDASFPVLLAEADVPSCEMTIVTRFWAKVQEINRGLENVDELRKAELMRTGANQSHAYQDDVARLILKCSQLTDKSGDGPIFQPAHDLVARKIARRRWWRLA